MTGALGLGPLAALPGTVVLPLGAGLFALPLSAAALLRPFALLLPPGLLGLRPFAGLLRLVQQGPQLLVVLLLLTGGLLGHRPLSLEVGGGVLLELEQAALLFQLDPARHFEQVDRDHPALAVRGLDFRSHGGDLLGGDRIVLVFIGQAAHQPAAQPGDLAGI